MKPFVLVRWNDAQDHPDKWVDAADAEAFNNIECEIISGGFLISQTDKYVTIGADYDAVDDDYGRVTKIPQPMIKTIIELQIEGEIKDEPQP